MMTNNEPKLFKEIIKTRSNRNQFEKRLYNNFEQYCYSISFSFFVLAIISHKNLRKIIKLEEL